MWDIPTNLPASSTFQPGSLSNQLKFEVFTNAQCVSFLWICIIGKL